MLKVWYYLSITYCNHEKSNFAWSVEIKEFIVSGKHILTFRTENFWEKNSFVETKAVKTACSFCKYLKSDWSIYLNTHTHTHTHKHTHIYVQYYYNLIESDFFKSEFSAVITSVFSVTWSFRNHSNILICCSRKISYSKNLIDPIY